MRLVIVNQFRVWTSATIVVCGLCLSPSAAAAPTSIPLCPGLTVVTAITQTEGDYESIKTVEAVGADGVRLKYANERPMQDYEGAPTKIRRISVSRVVRAEDVDHAHAYLQQYQATAPATVPGTTAIGVSSAILVALKTTGEAELSIFDLPPSPLSADPDNHPSIFDYRLAGKIKRTGDAPVMLALTVNDDKVELPAIHATGEFAGEKAEFFFLDDEANPLTLRFRLGIGSKRSADHPMATDRDTLQVIKIAYRCSGPSFAEGRLERALSKVGRPVDVYDIYFSFNSDKLRPESEPTLHELAGLLERHGGWQLAIGGHTDAIGGDAKNMDLSKRRSAAVKAALVERFKIDANRLVTSGYGESRPKDTNDTAEGRARNRRVELVRRK